MCLFCKIIAGEIPGTKVYEDNDTLAILDIAQTTRGHMLVMPKKHYDNMLQMPQEEFKDLMAKAQSLAQKITTNLDANGINLLINTNEAAGQTIPHVHVHLIPRYDENDCIQIGFSENHYDLNEIASQINKN
ncbi:MAG: HIT family protein [Erysipelotrichaceae bacterium]|nr:HIT family protein [Erysipelotrichaceae bacterium]